MKDHSEAQPHAVKRAVPPAAPALPPRQGKNPETRARTRTDTAGSGDIDPVREDAYWRNNYLMRDYVEAGASYDDNGPAYALGVETYRRPPHLSFDQAERQLSHLWLRNSGSSMLSWDEACPAARDAWNRLRGQP